MGIKIGINGFGRIGRQILKIGLEYPELEFVAVNDITDPKTLEYLFKYDSIYGRFQGDISSDDTNLYINNRCIRVFSIRDPSEIPWDDMGVEVVVEASGIFRSKDKAEKHLRGTVRKVIITAPGKGEPPDYTFVLGVNEDGYNPNDHNIVSNASCTTNAFAPMVKVIHENFRIKSGVMTTIHAYTNDQKILDQPHSDLRRARAAAVSIIPTSTGAAKAIELIFPELKGRISAVAMRVPVAVGSIVDFGALVESETTEEEVNTAFKKAQEGTLKGYLIYTDEDIVSQDIVGDPHSCIFDSKLTQVTGGNLIKVFGWYDNEWGYSTRIVDLVKFLISKGW